MMVSDCAVESRSLRKWSRSKIELLAPGVSTTSFASSKSVNFAWATSTCFFRSSIWLESQVRNCATEWARFSNVCNV